jgi:hypothetical protein
MSSREKQHHADGPRWAPIRQPESPRTGEIVIDLVNSVAVAVGGVYEITGSPLISTVAGGCAVMVVGLALGLRR